MLLQLAEFKYPNVHVEVISEDCKQLLTAMKKQYPNANFSCTTHGRGKDLRFTIQVCSTTTEDFQRISMMYFAQGFMASAHLWER